MTPEQLVACKCLWQQLGTSTLIKSIYKVNPNCPVHGKGAKA